MASKPNITTRRAILGVLAAAPALAVMSTAALGREEIEPTEDRFTREECDAATLSAKRLALCFVACAWLDRWTALGGDCYLVWRPDRSLALSRGMIEKRFWVPTDEGRRDLDPHTWLVSQEHHDGAVKALEGMLALLPGLREALIQVVGGRDCGEAA